MNGARVGPIERRVAEWLRVIRRNRWEAVLVVAVLCVALVLRLMVAAHLRTLWPARDAALAMGRGSLLADGWVYGSPEQGLDRFVATKQPPLFSILMGFVAEVDGSRKGAGQLLAVMSTATLGIIWWTARREFDRRTATVALLFGAVFGHMTMTGGLIMSEVLSQFLAALLLLIAPVAVRELRPLAVIASGLLCGLLALTRAELILVTPVVALALLVASGQRYGLRKVGRLVVGPLVLVLSCAATYAPWLSYTSQVLGRPVLSTGSGPFQLATSCATSLTGDLAGYRDPNCFLIKVRESDLRLGRTVDDLILDGKAQAQAADLREQSGANMFVARVLRVARGFGLYRPFQTAEMETDEGQQGPGWLANVSVVQWLVLLALAAPGLIVARRRGMPLAVVLGLGAAGVGAMVLGFGFSRYRSTFETAVVLMAAAGAVGLWRQGSRAVKHRPQVTTAHD